MSVNNATGRIECSISNKKNADKNTHVLRTVWNPFAAFFSFFPFQIVVKAKIVSLGKTIVRARSGAHLYSFLALFYVHVRTHTYVGYVCFMSACVHRIIFLFVSHKFWLVIFVINQYYFRFSTRPNSIRDSTNTEFDLPRRLPLEIDLQRLDSTRLDSKTIVFLKTS